jgi:adenylate kinase
MRSIVFHQRELFLCLTPSNLYRRLLRCVSSRSIDQESADELQRRQKLRSLAIEGTVNLYERHVFIIDNNFSPENWPKQLEQSDHLVAQYTKVRHCIHIIY